MLADTTGKHVCICASVHEDSVAPGAAVTPKGHSKLHSPQQLLLQMLLQALRRTSLKPGNITCTLHS